MSQGWARGLPLAMGVGLAACQPRLDTDCLERCATLDIGERECQTICSHDCDHLEQSYGISPEACHDLHEGPLARPEPPAGASKPAGS